ncbi:hypothetical protein BBO99_00002168 [Phytophthora kernoviae]|uniref:Uncharacterized protein n=2 Tax=Phytophthora kernoviae TaxID=325452 RepID=A0A3R7H0X0_9STRA|nr:hypothetical protein G195_002940 [Phytophthora kernoviae 00238/432]KAG2530831.1 hypothetical protein JM16_001138 [Phytophthora kernoviae]KAG2531093.1 hypothetical protein JM18_001576 [Phytophthora kernoviae]RLM95690.1 hypothetical protein BBI17_002075 [Phytophthora kernoviae]RLN83396.1 hypothetical protein BBO99_00002168 [Phytophthora kernoviae]
MQLLHCEAIVLVTHYRNVGSNSGGYSGLSLGLALLKYLARAKWLAKDVILLAADDGVLDGSDGYAPGTEAWLQVYHLDPVESGLQGVLPMRAGVIRAAVNLETMYDAHSVDAVGIYTAGMNGQLPNLDLVNTAVRSFRQHKIPIILDRADTEPRSQEQAGATKSNDFVSTSLSLLQNVFEKYGPAELKQSARDYLMNLKGMLHFMTTLASGPSGPHANFISYNIDSITLSLVKKSDSNDQLRMREVLQSIEMLVRALSNLEEKLHQSFFLYVLPSTTTFVSVGEYYYTVALAISPAIAHLLYLPNQMTGMRVAFALAVFLVVEALGAFLLASLCYYFGTPTALLGSTSANFASSKRWWVLAFTISTVQALVVVVVVPALRSVAGFSGCAEIQDWRKKIAIYEADQQNKQKEKTAVTSVLNGGNNVDLQAANTDPANDILKLDSGWRAIKFLTMALLVYGHCILGILNYPMALFCAIFMAHFARVVPFDTTSLLKNVWHGLWLFVSSPLVLLVLLNWSRLGTEATVNYLAYAIANSLALMEQT